MKLVKNSSGLLQASDKLFNVNERLDNRSHGKSQQDGNNGYDTQKFDHAHARLLLSSENGHIFI
jgi:hypothetical protein